MSIGKVVAVIDSCETVEQLEEASKYVDLFIKQHSTTSEVARILSDQLAEQFDRKMQVKLAEILI